MKKFSVVFLILILILFTAIIKNSTKRIDDEIFAIKEDIRGLKKDFENIRLEHEFLSSTEKLVEFQKLYFDDELVNKKIKEIKSIDLSLRNIKVKNLELSHE